MILQREALSNTREQKIVIFGVTFQNKQIYGGAKFLFIGVVNIDPNKSDFDGHFYATVLHSVY